MNEGQAKVQVLLACDFAHDVGDDLEMRIGAGSPATSDEQRYLRPERGEPAETR